MSQIVPAMPHPPSQDLRTGEWDDSRTSCGRRPAEVAFSVDPRYVNCPDCIRMSTPTPEVIAEYLAGQISGDRYSPTVRGPVEDVFIEGTVDLVEVAKALLGRFDITERTGE